MREEPPPSTVIELVTKGKHWSGWPRVEQELRPIRVERTGFNGRYRVYVPGTDDPVAARAWFEDVLDHVRPGWRGERMFVVAASGVDR